MYQYIIFKFIIECDFKYIACQSLNTSKLKSLFMFIFTSHSQIQVIKELLKCVQIHMSDLKIHWKSQDLKYEESVGQLKNNWKDPGLFVQIQYYYFSVHCKEGVKIQDLLWLEGGGVSLNWFFSKRVLVCLFFMYY
jgi:protein tyrosine phosphatase